MTAQTVTTSTGTIGQIFMPMHFSSVNQFTHPAFDPHSCHPRDKADAVKITRSTSSRSPVCRITIVDPLWKIITVALVLRKIAVFWGLISATLIAEPLVILVSIDGCRWDYPELHDAPTLQQLSMEGFRVERLVPSYPTKTFPNHYTLVTGLHPESHGIIQNQFWDDDFKAWFGIGAHPAAREGRWWGGEPIWITAQNQGLRTACVFWPGTEADIRGQRPHKWLAYDGDMPEPERVQQVLTWTALPPTERPHFITLYFEAVDSAGHDFGPAAIQTNQALHLVDDALRQLREGLIKQGLWESTHLIVTSDHGMTEIDESRLIILEDLIDLDEVRVVFNGASGGLDSLDEYRAPEIVQALDQHPHLHAFARANVPARFHFSSNPRIPDIVLIPDLGWKIKSRSVPETESVSGGDHGYDNSEPDMASIFIARGPQFKARSSLKLSRNTDVYNLLCHLLKITPAPNEGSQILIPVAD